MLAQTVKYLKQKAYEFISSVALQDDDKPFQSGNLNNLNERLGLNSIMEFLPFETYDELTEIYTCNQAKGFIFEVSPMVGASDNHVDVFYSLLQRILPEGAILHCLLYASPKIGDYFDDFVKARAFNKPLIKRLSERRAEFYKGGIYSPLIPGKPAVLRDYRLLIGIVFDNELDLKEQKILSLKNTLIGTLKGIGMSPTLLGPSQFLQWMDALLKPSDSLYEKEFEYHEMQPLSQQAANAPCSRIMTPSKIFIYEGENEGKWQIRNFRVNSFKNISPHLAEMSDLIGHLYDVSAQIGCPYSLSFVVQICSQAKEQAIANARAIKARQRAEKIARFSPKSIEEAGEARAIIKALEDNERLVLVSFQVSLYCLTEQADEHEAQLFNVFQASSVKWQLIKNHLLQMPMLLAHLPLAQSHALMKELSQLGLLYKLWAKNAANMLPVIAEMKGMQPRE